MHHTKDFQDLRLFVDEMNSSNSTNHKIDVLNKYHNNEFIKKVLQFTYHPYLNFGVTSANLKKRADLTSDSGWANLFLMLTDLNARIVTGHDAIRFVNGFISDYSEWADLIYQILDRNLETRATTTLINRVFPGLIPTFDVALAHDVTKVKGIDLTDGTWYVSRKLDGVRCICIVQNGTVKFISRNGKEFLTLGLIAEEIKDLGITDIVFDGEICLMNPDGSDDFQGILKQIQRKDHTIETAKYIIFDILTTDEFFGKAESPIFSKRIVSRAREHNYFQSTRSLSVLSQIKIENENSLASLKAESKDSNWEGLIARRDVPYKSGRSKDMLKIKEFFDAEYEVVDIIMGPQRVIVEGKEVEEEVLSAVIIEHKGSPVQVGSGFSMDERRHYFNNPQEIKGSVITVQYFEETTDQHGNNSLRFPVFKGNYGKKRSI